MALEDIHLFEMKNAFEETLTLETLDLSGNQLDELGGVYWHAYLNILTISVKSILLQIGLFLLAKIYHTIQQIYIML